MGKRRYYFSNLMSGHLDLFYEELCALISQNTGISLKARHEKNWQERTQLFDSGEVQIASMCGLYYTKRLSMQPPQKLRLLASPVMYASHYRHQPIYYSHILVRSKAIEKTFQDLRGKSIALNEPDSHSGFNALFSGLGEHNEADPFFSGFQLTGSHLNSLRCLVAGKVDSAIIDSTVLESEAAEDILKGSRGVRVLKTLGPSPAPPLVCQEVLPREISQRIETFISSPVVHPELQELLAKEGLSHFTRVDDEYFHDIRDKDLRARNFLSQCHGQLPGIFQQKIYI